MMVTAGPLAACEPPPPAAEFVWDALLLHPLTASVAAAATVMAIVGNRVLT
jgi:hypothetical protein